MANVPAYTLRIRCHNNSQNLSWYYTSHIFRIMHVTLRADFSFFHIIIIIIISSSLVLLGVPCVHAFYRPVSHNEVAIKKRFIFMDSLLWCSRSVGPVCIRRIAQTVDEWDQQANASTRNNARYIRGHPPTSKTCCYYILSFNAGNVVST